MSSTTMTIRLPPEVKAGLGRLATSTRRTKSFLAAEAIAAYVAREATIVDGVQAGLSDMTAGRVVSHDEAMARIEATIAEAERQPR